jgi:hypothetical protein
MSDEKNFLTSKSGCAKDELSSYLKLDEYKMTSSKLLHTKKLIWHP